MSQPPLDLTLIGTNTTNGTTSPIDLITIGTIIQTPRHKHDLWIRQHDQRILQSEKEKRTYQRTQSQTHHIQTHHRSNLIRWMTEIATNLEAKTNMIWPMIASTEYPKARNVIKIKIAGNTRNRTCQTHSKAILIRLTKVPIDARDAKIGRAIGKRILSHYMQG